MGLLDSVLGAVAGASGQGAPAGGNLMGVLVSLLAQGQGGQGLDLGSLLGKLQQGGLADAVASWVSTGPNQAISPDQLSNALGGDTLGQLAQALGLDANSAASHLSHILPQAVDALTPQGQLPQGGADLGSLATQVMGQFFSR